MVRFLSVNYDSKEIWKALPQGGLPPDSEVISTSQNGQEKPRPSKSLPVSAADSPAAPKEPYYTIEGKRVNVHNTPWGLVYYDMDLPPGAIGSVGSIYRQDEEGKLVVVAEIHYGRKGVSQVLMNGLTVPFRLP